MKKYVTLVRLVMIAVIVLAFGGLLGWYYFLQNAGRATTNEDVARGYGASAPSFGGTTGSTNENAASTLGGTGTSTFSGPAARLWEVSQVPVAGFGWTSSDVPTLEFVERSSGNVLQASPINSSVTRLTDTLRPEIYDAQITAGGSVLERSVDQSGVIITFAGVIATTTSTASTSTPDMLSGVVLPQNIRAVAADPFSDTLYYTVENPGGVSLVSTNWAGQKEKTLLSSALEQWRLLGAQNGSVVLLQAPLDGVVGYAYRLQKDGTFSLLAQAPGLTLSPDASSSAFLYGSSQGGVLSLFLQQGPGTSAQNLSLQTIADKCAWAAGAGETAYCAVPQQVLSQQFLDDWYKGLVHTSDTFYEIDGSAASTTLLYDPSGNTAAELDVEEPSVDPSGRYIAFINAADQSLWVLRIAP